MATCTVEKQHNANLALIGFAVVAGFVGKSVFEQMSIFRDLERSFSLNEKNSRLFRDVVVAVSAFGGIALAKAIAK